MTDTPAPLVGRDRELAALRAALATAFDGRGSLVLIGGEAGIGKTALSEAGCREAAGGGARVLVGRCYDLTETPPYGPWTEMGTRLSVAPEQPPLPAVLARGNTAGVLASQAALFDEVRDFLAALSARQPLVLLLDDLHWADPASLELLRFLARQMDALPVCFVVTYRADELTRRHPLYHLLPVLVREARAIRVDLRPDIRT
jgi:predicted ATPase